MPLERLFEFIGREQKRKRGEVTETLGAQTLRRIYRYADVLHCEPIAKVADEYINMCGIETGGFDNVAKCKYEVPDYWAIGAVYARLVEDVMTEEPIAALMKIYQSWISDSISNYNSDFFYQPRDYIKECYLAGEVL
ncbi:MAG: hypothetical protein IJY09_00945 [Lachnospiraceae bacterium]|nr:hypothetical protein [Lachnospiraceae bacterium]